MAIPDSVYAVATYGEAVDLQQVFLWRFGSHVAVQARVRVDDLVVVVFVRRCEELVRIAIGDGGSGAVGHAGQRWADRGQ